MQEVITSKDAISNVVSLVHEKGFQKLLLITGTHIESDFLSHFQSSLQSKVRRIAINAGLPSVSNLAGVFNQLEFIPDILVAVGGGRILDTAKLMIHSGLSKRPFFIAIPTTAGSGSESTPFAVSYTGIEKVSISDDKLLPDLVILDPAMLNSLSEKQKAVSGMDALTQSIESIWNKHATKESTDIASQSVEILWNNLEAYVLKTPSLAEKIQWAACLSGKAIAITRTTGCHALSYYLTTKHGIPHGQAVAIFLPLFFIYNEKKRTKANKELELSMKKIFDLLGSENAFDTHHAITFLMTRINLATTFSELNIEVDIDALLDSVNQERFSNHPVPFDKKVLKDIIIQNLV